MSSAKLVMDISRSLTIREDTCPKLLITLLSNLIMSQIVVSSLIQDTRMRCKTLQKF